MGAPSYEFTGDEVASVLAREAARVLGLVIEGDVRIDMRTRSTIEDGVTSISVTLHSLTAS